MNGDGSSGGESLNDPFKPRLLKKRKEKREKHLVLKVVQVIYYVGIGIGFSLVKNIQ